MRTLLVCCLAVVACVASNSPRPFQGQQTYVYRFDTQVSSSLIGASPAEIQQAAATRLRADAILSFSNDRNARLQLQHIRIGELNADLPKSQRVQPFEHFERKEVPTELKEMLEMPLSVTITDGVIERINFHEDDSTWSKNIKRAVLNMLQLNLKRNDVQGLKMQSSMPEDSDKQSPMFSIPEITLEGECEAVYTVQKSQRYGSDDDERTPFNVTKTVNFNKCQKTADVEFGYEINPSEQLRCLQCLRQQKTHEQDAQQREQARFGHCQQACNFGAGESRKDLEKSTFGRFELIGKTDKYAIKRSSMLSQYIVKAQNPSSQNTLIQVVAVSELTFKDQLDNSQQKVPTFKQSSQDETLLYSNEWDVKEKRFLMNGDEEFEKQSPFYRVQKKEQKAAHAIRQLLRQWSDKKQGYELDSALNFNRLVEVVRKSSVPEIKQIEQAMLEVAQKHEGEPQDHSRQLAQTIFQDCLAAAATRNSLFVLAEKIMKSEISAPKAVQLLKSYTTSQIAPSESQVAILEKIAKHEVSHRSPALKQTAWLVLGQTIGAICQDKPSQGQKQQFRVEEVCTRGKKEQYKQTMMKQWKQAESIYEQILALKTIGNAALDNMIEEIQQIIKNKQMPTLVRMEGIDALRRLRTSQAQKIQQILLPIFQNQREQPEIRMACVSMIMYTQPQKSILDQLVFTTLNDRSQNLKSFVLTTLESLSKSPSSAEQEVANHMKAALKMVKLQPEEMRSSRKYRVPVYVSEQENTEEQNIFLSLAAIVSPSNMLPVHLSTSMQSAFNGEATKENIQISISQKNLEQWYERIAEYAQQYGRDNERSQDESMERRSAKDLRSIYSSLGVKNRRAGSYYLSSSEESDEQQGGEKLSKRGEPFGMIVIRSNDVDYNIIPISEHQMPEVVRKLLKGEKPSLLQHYNQFTEQLASGHRFQQHIAAVMGEKRVKVPTTSGLPLALLRQTSGVGSVQGELKVRFESEDLDASRGLTAELKLRTSGIATHMHKAEVWSPILISGVQSIRTVEVNGPADLKIRADKQKVELKMKLPTESKVRFLAIHTLPTTFTRQFNLKTQTQGEARVKTINNWALEHTLREHQQQQWRDNAIQVEGHYHHVTNAKQILQAMYTTENNVHVYFVPNERTPKEITLRASGSAFERHQQHSRPEMDAFYSKGFKQSIYEDEDDSQMQDKDYESRRSSLSSYSQKYSDKDAYKHELRMEVEAHCGQKIHKAMAEIKGACDASLRHCKLFVEAERTPLHTESNKWTMKTKIQTVMPEPRQQDDEEMSSDKQSRMLCQVDASWGSEERNQMNIRLQAEPTRKQGQKSRFLNKIDMVAEYKLHSQQKHVIQRAYELLKAKLFWSLSSSVEDKRSSDGDNVVRATITIDPVTRRHANFSIQTPTERLRAQSIELPTRVSPYTLQRRPSSIRSFGHLVESVSNYGGAECRANDRRITTFDDVSYKAPMSQCWTVLAKDCSRDEPRFVVMGKKSGEEKKVKIITPRSTIELISKQSQKPIVKINGKVETNEEKLSEHGIEQTYNQVYVSISGVKVQADGEELKIKVSGMHKNQVCGLCGHYSDEEGDDFQMPSGQRTSSLKEFHKSYTLKNEECNGLDNFYSQQDSDEFQVKPRKQQSRRQQSKGWFDSESSSESEEEQRRSEEKESTERQGDRKSSQPKPVKRTMVIEYQHRVCFSLDPVKKCPRNSSPKESETEQMNVKFFCLDRASSEARRLQRQVRNGEIVETEGRQSSFVEQVEVPTKCQSAEFY